MPEPGFNSFVAFVESVVLPGLLGQPTRLRLDGRKRGGNRDVAGRFLHDGSAWKVHADTRYEPILLAYWSLKFHPDREALVRATTDEMNERLDLAPRLKAVRATTYSHLYIYLSE